MRLGRSGGGGLFHFIGAFGICQFGIPVDASVRDDVHHAPAVRRLDFPENRVQFGECREHADLVELLFAVLVGDGHAARNGRVRKGLRGISFVKHDFYMRTVQHLLVPGLGRGAGVEEESGRMDKSGPGRHAACRVDEIVAYRRVAFVVSGRLDLIRRVSSRQCEREGGKL